MVQMWLSGEYFVRCIYEMLNNIYIYIYFKSGAASPGIKRERTGEREGNRRKVWRGKGSWE